MIADADVPRDDLGLLQALSEVGQIESAHANSKNFARRRDDARGAGEIVCLQARQRHDGVVSGHAAHRGEQAGQPLIGQACCDLGADATGQRRLVDDDAAPTAFDRLQDRGHVQRLQRRDIDHLGLDAVGRQGIGSGNRLLNHRPPGDERQVRALAQHETGVERRRLTVVFHRLLERPIDPLGLQEDHRIGIADRRQEQTVGASRR